MTVAAPATVLALAAVMALPVVQCVPAARLERTRADMFPHADDDLWQPDEVEAVVLADVDVIWANYDLLRRDFPQALGKI